MDTPQGQPSVDVAQLIDGQKIGGFLLSIVCLGFAAQISDGYDLAAAAYAAPGIIHDWHLNRAMLAPVFSASIVGMLFGAPFFGYIGDRNGRRSAIIFCSLLCAVFTLASAGAHSLLELGILRFFTGLGLGGLPANTIALMAEYAPRRARAMLITLMFMGITVGGIVPAIVTASAPDAGWPLLFLVGGTMPLVAAALNFFFLPESFKFLALRSTSTAPLIALARRISPLLSLPANVQFRFAHQPGQRVPLSLLFAGKLRWITPLVWTLFITNLVANFILNSWMPTAFRAAGLSSSDAAITTSMYYVGGVLGGLTISRALDRSGVGIVAAFMFLACPAVALLGVAATAGVGLKLAVFAVGITVLGNQLGLNAVLGLIYPTAIRASGSGWALGIGRFGAIIGPLIGGLLLSQHLNLQWLFMAPTVPLFIGGIAGLILRFYANDRFGGRAEAEPTLLEPQPPALAE